MKAMNESRLLAIESGLSRIRPLTSMDTLDSVGINASVVQDLIGAARLANHFLDTASGDEVLRKELSAERRKTDYARTCLCICKALLDPNKSAIDSDAAIRVIEDALERTV